MEINETTISFLARIITGDNKISFYRTGPQLVRFFNQIGFDDEYGQSFPSRWWYAEENIRKLNRTDELIKVFDSLLDPRNYMDNEKMLEEVVINLNKYLKFDGYEIVKVDNFFKIKDLKSGIVEISKGIEKLSHEFIKEQIEKCDKKILSEDFDGAITNARSLVEAVLSELEKQLDINPPEYDGDLIKLYRRVQKSLNLEPSRQDISNSLRQVLGGLNSIVVGLAGLRNKMSDSHCRTYKPEKHHAILVVNSAKTLISFLLDTFEYNKKQNS
jgi:hypothetical protein